MTAPLRLRIEALELRELRMPLRAEFETSFARVAHREVVVVALRADGGLVGWGEAPVASRPHFSEETTRTAWHAIEDFIAPALVGRTFDGVDSLLAAFAWIRWHRMARAAVEGAFRDLLAKAEGVPLARSLGATRDRIPAGVSIGIPAGEDAGALVAEVARRLDEGYRRVKIKVRPGFDLVPVEAVRRRFGDGLAFAADGNGAYRLADFPTFQTLDRFGLLFLEQPLHPDDLVDHAQLARAIETRVCLDESLKTPHDVEAALALEAVEVVNLKPARVGGTTAALAVHDLCVANGLPLWCGGMLETGIGRAHNVALAALPGFTLPGDISASDRYYADDVEIVDPPFRVDPATGDIAVPTGPGIGVEVLVERLDKLTAARRIF